MTEPGSPDSLNQAERGEDKEVIDFLSDQISLALDQGDFAKAENSMRLYFDANKTPDNAKKLCQFYVRIFDTEIRRFKALAKPEPESDASHDEDLTRFRKVYKMIEDSVLSIGEKFPHWKNPVFNPLARAFEKALSAMEERHGSVRQR